MADASVAGGHAGEESVVAKGKKAPGCSEASSSDAIFAPASASASTLDRRKKQEIGQHFEHRNGQILRAWSGSSVRDSLSLSSTEKVPQVASANSVAISGRQTFCPQIHATAAIAYRRKHEKTYSILSALVLVAWSVYFGASTRHRCEDWNSER